MDIGLERQYQNERINRLYPYYRIQKHNVMRRNDDLYIPDGYVVRGGMLCPKRVNNDKFHYSEIH